MDDNTRTKNTLRNSIYGIGSYFIIAIISFLVRKVFLRTLPIEVLGYEGLFGNVFALISLADLGLENVILYRLFPAVAKKDKKEISNIISIYRWLYKMVGFAILLIGIILIPFLKYIIADGEYEWGYVYSIYIIQLIITLTSYFLAYKRIIFVVCQREYECTKVDTAGSIILGILRLITLLTLKSYYIYLLCGLCSNLLCNYIISRKVDKEYAFLTLKKKIRFQDVKGMSLGKDIKNNFIQKICAVIYGGTDNIVISAILGITQVGLFANYTMVITYITSFFVKLLRPFQVAIGDYIYSNDEKNSLSMFRMFDFVSFLLACVIATSYCCLFNPVISLLFGNQYLFSQYFVFAFTLNQYILWNHHLLTHYRNALGKFELDKYPIIIAAILNIVFSLVLGKFIGIAGIMLGTAIGHFGFWFGRVKVVYKIYIQEPMRYYIIRQFFRAICCIGEMAITYYICSLIDISVIGVLFRLLLTLTIPCIFNFIFFNKTNEMNNMIDYCRRIVKLVIDKRYKKTRTNN